MPRIKVVLEFIPVEEKLPKKEAFYPALAGNKQLAVYYFNGEEFVWLENVPVKINDITHWAEVPKIEQPVEENRP